MLKVAIATPMMGYRNVAEGSERFGILGLQCLSQLKTIDENTGAAVIGTRFETMKKEQTGWMASEWLIDVGSKCALGVREDIRVVLLPDVENRRVTLRSDLPEQTRQFQRLPVPLPAPV